MAHRAAAAHHPRGQVGALGSCQQSQSPCCRPNLSTEERRELTSRTKLAKECDTMRMGYQEEPQMSQGNSHPCSPSHKQGPKGKGPGDHCVCALRLRTLVVSGWVGFAGTRTCKGTRQALGRPGNGKGTCWGMVQSKPELKAIGISGL